MLKLAANLSTMFTDVPLEARFALAAQAGFAAVEMQFPYQVPPRRLADLLREHDLDLVLFNAPAGDLAAGERGLVLAGGERLDAAIETALVYADATGCRRVHLMVGNRPGGVDPDPSRIADRVARAARRCAQHGVDILLEALNARDQPFYALPLLADAEALRLAAGEANVKLQFDAYHVARSDEDPNMLWCRYAGNVGHVQIAAAYDRGEPDDAQMQSFLRLLEETGWQGHVGCEYTPRGDSFAGLGWADRFGIAMPRCAAGSYHG